MKRFGLGRAGTSGRHMTFFRRRRPDDWDSQHERARVLSALELVERLPAADATWLAEHLATCASCTQRAAAYAADRTLLRELRDSEPEPPRDLWARTAAAIEEEAERRAGPARWPLLERFGAVPLGAASGLLVVAVVIGVTLSGNNNPDLVKGPFSPPPTAAGPQATAGPTPLAVPPNQVAWVQRNDAGTYDLVVAGFDTVCGADLTTDCAPIEANAGRSLELARAPGSIVLSPNAPQVVVVDADTSTTGGAIFVVPVPAPAASFEPGATPTPTATPTPVATPTPEPPTDDPGTSPGTTPGATPSASPEPTPSPTPSPIADGAVAIIDGVIVVGEAAYSTDGSWFAFSARPADGSAGPDIYVWHVTDAVARPVTSDHRSVFAGWLDDLILGSRAVEVEIGLDELEASPDVDPTASPSGAPSTGPTPSPVDATSSPDALDGPAFLGVAFVLDPTNGAALDLTGSTWRPAVDPNRRMVVRWEGDLVGDGTGISWSLGFGQLVLDPWTAPERPTPPPDGEATPDPDPSADPAVTPDPEDSPDPDASPVPSTPPAPVISRMVIADGPIFDFDARWDPSGTHLAVWIADAADPRIGSLRLFAVDPETGQLTPSEGKLDGAPALRGFSLENGRLAWVTPPGQDGQGSRVQVVAWSLDEFGTIESPPGVEVIVGR